MSIVDDKPFAVVKGNWAFNIDSDGGAGTAVFSWSLDGGVTFTPISDISFTGDKNFWMKVPDPGQGLTALISVNIDGDAVVTGPFSVD